MEPTDGPIDNIAGDKVALGPHRREARRLGGRAYDIILMDCLATEFRSPLLHRLLPDG